MRFTPSPVVSSRQAKIVTESLRKFMGQFGHSLPIAARTPPLQVLETCEAPPPPEELHKLSIMDATRGHANFFQEAFTALSVHKSRR